MFESAKTYLPAWAVKSLRVQAPPIADDTIPEPTSLRSFWEWVDHAMHSLDPSFENYQNRFTREHVQRFGPHLVGFEGWQQICDRDMVDWWQFEKEVESVFGLSSE